MIHTITEQLLWFQFEWSQKKIRIWLTAQKRKTFNITKNIASTTEKE